MLPILVTISILLQAEATEDTCRLPALKGPCRAELTLWYFNSLSGQCEQFTYGGCKGNYNRFYTAQQCYERCSDQHRAKQFSSSCNFVSIHSISTKDVIKAYPGSSIGSCAMACQSHPLCSYSSLSSDNECFLSSGQEPKWCEHRSYRIELDQDRSRGKFVSCMSHECGHDVTAERSKFDSNKQKISRHIPTRVSLVDSKGCKPNEFQCTDNSCIPIGQWCDGEAQCADESDEKSDLCFWQLMDSKRCGFIFKSPIRRYGTRTKRIVEGTVAAENTWPWLVAIKNSTDGEQFCGGAIISKRWIVTAAHCVHDVQFMADSVEVTTSEYDLGIPNPDKESFAVKSIYVHPTYTDESDSHDVAVMQLDRDMPVVTKSAIVEPSCLARPTPDNPPKPGSTTCFVAGWGNLDYETEEETTLLHQVEIPILPNEDCDFMLDESMMCGGHLDASGDTCQGDSGGPWVCQDANTPSLWVQQGIVSFGDECNLPGTGGVYSKLSTPSIFSWIVGTVRDHDDAVMEESFSPVLSDPMLIVPDKPVEETNKGGAPGVAPPDVTDAPYKAPPPPTKGQGESGMTDGPSPVEGGGDLGMTEPPIPVEGAGEPDMTEAPQAVDGGGEPDMTEAPQPVDGGGEPDMTEAPLPVDAGGDPDVTEVTIPNVTKEPGVNGNNEAGRKNLTVSIQEGANLYGGK